MGKKVIAIRSVREPEEAVRKTLSPAWNIDRRKPASEVPRCTNPLCPFCSLGGRVIGA
jgi:hypothetical protein